MTDRSSQQVRAWDTYRSFGCPNCLRFILDIELDAAKAIIAEVQATDREFGSLAAASVMIDLVDLALAPRST